MPDFGEVFAKLDSHKPRTGAYAGLEPQKAVRRSKTYATDPDRAWQILVAGVIGLALLAAGFFQ